MGKKNLKQKISRVCSNEPHDLGESKNDYEKKRFQIP